MRILQSCRRHIVHLVPVLLALVVAAPSSAEAPPAASAIAARVAKAAGVDAFAQLGELRFTWKHTKSGTARHYVWNIAAKTVAVTADGQTTTVPIAGPANPEAEVERKAHSAFINDSYWLLFELHLAWDTGVSFDDLGVVPVPQHPKLGTLRGLRVRYGTDGGYTPGDAYVLYLGDDDLPLAWAFHKGGQSEPNLVSTRTGRTEVKGVSLVTRFELADGTPFISIDVEP